MRNLIIVCLVIFLLAYCTQTPDTWSELDTHTTALELDTTPNMSKRPLIKSDPIPSSMEVEGQYTWDTTVWVKFGKGAYLYKRDATTFDAVFEPNSREEIGRASCRERVKRWGVCE